VGTHATDSCTPSQFAYPVTSLSCSGHLLLGGFLRPIAAAAFVATTTGVALGHFDGYPKQPCDNQPPATARRPIAVPVSIVTVPSSDMFTRCRKQPGDLVIYGCTFLPKADHPAQIFLNGSQTDQERACTLVYEEAHLPPNNWLDQAMEAMAPDARQ